MNILAHKNLEDKLKNQEGHEGGDGHYPDLHSEGGERYNPDLCPSPYDIEGKYYCPECGEELECDCDFKVLFCPQCHIYFADYPCIPYIDDYLEKD